MNEVEHLSLAHGDVKEHQFLALIQRESIPGAVPVISLDLTQSYLNKNITFLRYLESLTHLETIVLDKNELDSLIGFPPILSLRCLWVNNNCISDLVQFIDNVSYLFPSLEELSMLRNPACPGYMDIQRPDYDSIKMFRTYVVWRLPRLHVVDGINVTDIERAESKHRGPLAITHRPPIQKKLGGGVEDGERGRYCSHNGHYKTAKRATMKAYHNASAWTSRALGFDTVNEIEHVDSTGLQPKPQGFNEDIRRSNRHQHMTIVTRRRSEYSGHHSEGNRYIKDEEL